MARQASFVAGEFARQAQASLRFVEKCDQLTAKGYLSLQDQRRIYANAYLSAFLAFEGALEALFFGLLLGSLRSGQSGVRPRVQLASSVIARDLVLGGRPYVEWTPYHLTEERAKIYFAKGRPFSLIPGPDKDALARHSVMRNALAHSSRHAQARFAKVFVEGKNLPPVQQKPAGYLAGAHSIGVSRLAFMLAELNQVLLRLAR